MILDSGASLVVLNDKIIRQVGIEVLSSAETIYMKIADGSTIPGKRIILSSVRVGKFTVKNVEAVVLGPEMKGAEPLLGMSFLSNFNFKINPDTSTLSIVKIEGTGK